MFKLIREFLLTAIAMNKATEKAFEMSYKNSVKNIEYLDNRINHDLILQEKELEYWVRKMKAEFPSGSQEAMEEFVKWVVENKKSSVLEQADISKESMIKILHHFGHSASKYTG